MTLTDIRQLISCIDLTSLNADDTPPKIAALCQKAKTSLGNVAAVCIYPQFVTQSWKALADTSINIATVANFPEGNHDLDAVSQVIQQAIKDGASEIDVVIPYHEYQHNDREVVRNFIAHCKQLCGNKALLKTILETGALTSLQIQHASKDAIDSGADFLKTSTGKISAGATPEAATIMLNEIKKSNKPVGFKASGGVRTLEQAQIYVNLVKQILGEKAFCAQRFRVGASTLLEQLLESTHAENC